MRPPPNGSPNWKKPANHPFGAPTPPLSGSILSNIPPPHLPRSNALWGFKNPKKPAFPEDIGELAPRSENRPSKRGGPFANLPQLELEKGKRNGNCVPFSIHNALDPKPSCFTPPVKHGPAKPNPKKIVGRANSLFNGVNRIIKATEVWGKNKPI
ncbi:hypothetical protein JTB14_029933 [Gonioctena quinquepunctata]|nr:hypothetical protein JTB14_029933 [Gonioctena quinquepunctata]